MAAKKQAKPTPAAKPEPYQHIYTLEGAKPYSPRVDWTESGWGELLAAVEAKVTCRTLRSKDTPITSNNDNRGFAGYCYKRGWLNKVNQDGTIARYADAK